MDFLEDPPFPSCPSFGFTSEPRYRVTNVVTAGGHSRRKKHWTRPLHKYTASVGPRNEREVADLLEFYHAVGGRAYGFRFFDYVDYKSCHIDQDVSMLDQPLVAAIDSSGDYQLTKVYEAGVHQQIREIVKPIDGTILIADNGVLKTEGADYTIDYTTGLVSLNFTPVGFLSWGGQFHVPARFDSEVPVEIVNKNIHSASFALAEIRITGGLES